MRNILAALLITITTQSSLALEKSDLSNLKSLLAATDNEALASALVQHCLPMLEETPAQSDESSTTSSKPKVHGDLDFYCECALELKEVQTNAGFEVLYEDCTSAAIASNIETQTAELERKHAEITEIEFDINELEEKLQALNAKKKALISELQLAGAYPFENIAQKIIFLISNGSKTPLSNNWISHNLTKYKGSVLPQASPEEQYNFALNRAMTNDLETANAAFAEYLRINEGHERTADALFWIGRIQFLMEDFESSALTFAEFSVRYSNDARVIDTTKWLVEAISRFASAEQACAVYAAVSDFLDEPTEDFTERIATLSKSSNCDSQEIQKPISKPVPKPATPVGIEDIARIQEHVSKCWQPPLGAAGNDTLKVDIFVVVNEQGEVNRVEIEDRLRYSLDSYFKASAIAAQRAIVECSPLPIPPEKYEQLKEFTFSFDPRFISR